MLCAFFNKRITGEDAEATVSALFAPFWSESKRYVTLPDIWRNRGKQWEIPSSWRSRAEQDGTLRALTLLDFRINRLLGLLFVSDCWESIIGLHLAYWLDTHMHLVIECERRKSGPTRECTVHEDVLRLCDWRHERTTHLVAIREIFCTEKGISSLGDMYYRVVNNMALCKTRDKTFAELALVAESREAFREAFVRCVLGTGPNKADFSLRKNLHGALKNDGKILLDLIEDFCDKNECPIVFIAMREYIVDAIRKDLPLHLYAQTTPKWTQFSENTRNCAEMIRLLLRQKSGDGDLFRDKLVVSEEENQSLLRLTRKVPGLFSRTKREFMSLAQVCKILKRQRGKSTTRLPTVVEEHVNAELVATEGTRLMRTLRLGDPLPFSFVLKSLRESGDRACRIFVAIAEAAKLGTDALSHKVSEVVELDDAETKKDGFSVVHTCLEMMRQCESSFEMRLPDQYAEKQRRAAERRFPRLRGADAWTRASELVWCDGCKCVKNFIQSGNKPETRVAHGYKRVCRDENDIMCFEKKRFLCCRNVPLRTKKLIDEDKSITATLFGATYVMTTCCGNITVLEMASPWEEEPLCCQQCVSLKTAKTLGSVLTCHYCGEMIKKKKGTYTGQFLTDDEKTQKLTFCKRHTRSFMKKEREPLVLSECLTELSKGIL